MNIPTKTIERLSLYKRVLKKEFSNNREFIHSHEIGDLSNNNAAQVRRDLMYLDMTASTYKGYKINDLINSITNLLESSQKQKVGIIGIGNMGRAIISYFKRKGGNLTISVGFDIDPYTIGRVIDGCPCYHVNLLESIIKQEGVTFGIIATPESEAQTIANNLVKAGVKGVINLCPIPVKVPNGIILENLDIISRFEKAAFLSMHNTVNYKPINLN